MQTEVNTKHFDTRIQAASQSLSALMQLNNSGVKFHADYCNDRVKTVQHAIAKANAEIFRTSQAKDLFKQGVPFGVAISAANRNAVNITELDPDKHQIEGEVVTSDKETETHFVCVSGRIVKVSQYFVVISNGEYSLVRLTKSL